MTDTDLPPGVRDLVTIAQHHATQRDFAVAEPLFRQALDRTEAAMGPTHGATADRLVDLAYCCAAQQHYAEAADLLQRALMIRETTLGVQHRDTVAVLLLRGDVLAYTSDGTEAERCYRQGLAIQAAVYGIDHPETVLSLNNLAMLLTKQRRDSEAYPLFQRALAIWEPIHGPDDPMTQVLRVNLRVCAAPGEIVHELPAGWIVHDYGPEDHPPPQRSQNQIPIWAVLIGVSLMLAGTMGIRLSLLQNPPAWSIVLFILGVGVVVLLWIRSRAAPHP